MEFIFIRIIKQKMKKERKLLPEDLIYTFVVFKLKGHTTWRICDGKSFKDIKTAFDEKYILVDRITGQIKIN